VPLDVDARRYAENLFAEKRGQIEADAKEKVLAIHQDFRSRKMTQSGMYVKAMADERAGQLKLLCEARIESLIAAYERAGLPFDAEAHREIADDISQFRSQTEIVFARRIQGLASSTFPNHTPEGFENAVLGDFASATNRLMESVNRRLQIRRDEVLLDEKRQRKIYAAGLGKKWDAFISHASEDKDDFVRPLAQSLTNSGLSIWYDEFTLTVGDSLRRKIDEGLTSSRYGVVVLSPTFFAKRWPQEELDGLYSREVAGVKVILPVWHNLTATEVMGFSPLLAGKVAATGDVGNVVAQLRKAMGL
jgi:hypothetical protein